MKKVTRIQTKDGKIHLDTRAAKAHLDKILADLLSKPAHDLAFKKYGEIVEYLSVPENLKVFAKAYAVYRDMELEQTEDDDATT